MFKGLFGLLASLPELIRLGKAIAKFCKETFGDSPKKVIKESREVVQKLNESKTLEEKKDAAKKLRNLTSRLNVK